MPIFVTYTEAKKIVQSLGIKTAKEYQLWAAGKIPNMVQKPGNVPSCPHQVYKNSGWHGYGDYLGTKVVANHKRKFRNYKDAKLFVRGLKLSSSTEWDEYAKGNMSWIGTRPADIPSNPNFTYAGKGWENFSEWLGSGRPVSGPIDDTFWPFDDARDFVRSLGLSGFSQWRDYVTEKLLGYEPKPSQIPSNPHATYSTKGWVDYGDWLGTDNKANHKQVFLNFEDAKDTASTLRLKDCHEWREYIRANKAIRKKIPYSPERYYAQSGWNGYKDFLGVK